MSDLWQRWEEEYEGRGRALEEGESMTWEGKDWIAAEEIQRWVGLPAAEIESILSGMGHKVIRREDMGSKPHFRLHSYDDE